MIPSTSPENDLTAAEGDPTGGGTGGAASVPVTPAEGEQPLPPDIAELSYEAARDQLVEVVRRLESGQGGLEDSIGLWERGEMLARRCQQWLDGARERLDDAVAARRGEGTAER
jgi:exodeoxyribonuclease VII small subunit